MPSTYDDRASRPRPGTARTDVRRRRTADLVRRRSSCHDVGDGIRRDAGAIRSAWRPRPRRRADARPSAARRFASSAAKRRRRPDDQDRPARRRGPGLEIRLPQVQQMAARLHLARAAEVGRIDAQAVERIGAGDDDVIGEDRAELERERVERSFELVSRRRAAAWRARAHATPATRAAHARRSSGVMRRRRQRPHGAGRGRARRPSAGRALRAPYATSDCRRAEDLAQLAVEQ